MQSLGQLAPVGQVGRGDLFALQHVHGRGAYLIQPQRCQNRRQRNRIHHFEIAVPSDLVQTRLATTVAAGGRLLDESEDRWRVADPEGNELVIVSGA
ncbi:MAG: hypothetical protein M3400_06400 [Actinomycetota bacterium]|nr:hypothetical protein [Actinomycetota bacterium]